MGEAQYYKTRFSGWFCNPWRYSGVAIAAVCCCLEQRSFQAEHGFQEPVGWHLDALGLSCSGLDLPHPDFKVSCLLLDCYRAPTPPSTFILFLLQPSLSQESTYWWLKCSGHIQEPRPGPMREGRPSFPCPPVSSWLWSTACWGRCRPSLVVHRQHFKKQ